MNKPPMGIMPKHIWDDARRKELEKVIDRYIKSNKSIPFEWLNELSNLENNDGKSQDDYLLVIKVKDLDSVPEIYYKGEKKEALVNIDYQWITKGEGEKDNGKHEFYLSHYESSEDIWTESISFKRLEG